MGCAGQNIFYVGHNFIVGCVGQIYFCLDLCVGQNILLGSKFLCGSFFLCGSAFTYELKLIYYTTINNLGIIFRGSLPSKLYQTLFDPFSIFEWLIRNL